MGTVQKYQPRCRVFLMDGKKFRTNLLVLFFDIPLKRETATKTALIAEVLKKWDWQNASKEAEALYGALWDISVIKKGNRQLLLFSMETLKNVEMEEVLSFLRSRILEINFDEKTVQRQKEILKRKLEGLADDKKAYARKRALEETAGETDFGISADGYVEDVEEISCKMLQDWYRYLLEKAGVNIFFCGDKTEKKKILSLRQDFTGENPFLKKEVVEKGKHAPRFIQEAVPIEQARLVMGFQGDIENSCRQVALRLLNYLLGGSADSLLFQEVREKGGLCYDIKSDLEPMSPYLFVQAGVRKEDAKEAGKQVLNCLEKLKKEGISPEKMMQAKENIQRDYDSLSDSPWAMMDFFAEQVLLGKELTTEKWQRQIEKIEAEDLIRAAKHLELRTVYLLESEEDDHGTE